MPNSVSVLIEKPNSFTNANVPISETGMVMAGISVVRQFCRNRNMTSTTSAIASSKRRHHLADRLCHHRRRIEGHLDLQAGRETLRQAGDFGVDVAVHLQGVRGRQLQHTEPDRVTPLIARRRAVALRAQFGAPDIPDAYQRAVGGALHDDVLELRRIGQSSGRANADRERLPFPRRLLPDRARRDLDVLFPQRRHHIVRREAASGKTVGIEPDPHRVTADAEHLHVADAGNALDFVNDEAIEVVADEERIVLALL